MLNIAQDHFKMTQKFVFMEAKYKRNESSMFMILTDKNPSLMVGVEVLLEDQANSFVGLCDLQLCHHLFSSPEMLVET